MLIKLADLRWHQRRNRPPYLVGNAAGFDLLLVGRHNPAPGEPDFTLLIGRFKTTTGAKPLPPIWDDQAKRWIGPDNEAIPASMTIPSLPSPIWNASRLDSRSQISRDQILLQWSLRR